MANFGTAYFNKEFKGPYGIASQYIQLNNGLSYAQTYYPKSKVITYLNQLAAKAFQKIYKTKREDTNRIVEFWKTEVPLIVYEYRKYIYLAFAISTLFTAIGAISAANDGEFVRSILGDQYVDMTLENIENGNPVAVYKSGSNWGSFIAVFYPNLTLPKIYFV